jgi:uncharacterized protein YfiM (DUF2279 family)
MQQAWEKRDASAVIRLVRWNTDLSQTALARITGLVQSTVFDIISGKTDLKHQGRIDSVLDGFWPHRQPGAPIPATRAPSSAPTNSSVVSTASVAGSSENLWQQVAQLSEPEAAHILRRADRQATDTNLYGLVMRYLTSRVGPALVAEESGSATFIAAAGLTEMAGWMAHDSGHDDLAARHFQRALNLARAGEDTTLTAQIWASRAHLALYRVDTEAALIAAEQAWRHLDGREDTALRGRVLAMLTRAHAARGDAVIARRFLAQAEHLLSVPTSPRSQWTSPFDLASLASEAARGLHDLKDHAAAADHARHVLCLRSPERARARALASLTLARALLSQGQVEEAASVAGQIAASEAVKGSAVAEAHLRTVARELGPYRRIPEVATVLLDVDENRARAARPRPAVEGVHHER